MRDYRSEDQVRGKAGALLFRARQIGVLGSSGDIATPRELALAEMCGAEIARRGLVVVVAGDDGVMGAAARGAKRQGGTTVAIIPHEKTIQDIWNFDTVVDTGLNWVQFSDAVLKTCSGVIVVGGGAGTLAELSTAYLGGTPLAFLGADSELARRFGNQPLDRRGLASFPTFEDPAEALDCVIAQFKASVDLDTTSLLDDGETLHMESYPFGIRAEYAAAAEHFRGAAAVTSPRTQRSAWLGAMIRWYDALGEHFYYDVEDFLRAAACFSRAAAYAREVRGQADAVDKGLVEYLRPVMLESIALGLDKAGEIPLAKIIIEEAARWYDDAAATAAPDERPFLEHSCVGLLGLASYYEALILYRDGRLAESKAAVGRARERYDEALKLAPRWGEGCSSDNYARWISEVDHLDGLLAQADEARS